MAGGSAKDLRSVGSSRSRAAATLRGVPVVYWVVGAIGAVLVFIFIRYTVDDAFISWRYALTFVRHGEWNYSAGVPRVEGYTDFLYTAAAVVPAVLHIPIELFFKLVALLVLGSYVLAVRRVPMSRTQKVTLLAIALCNPTFMILLFSGLETVSFTLLIALLFALVYRNGRLGSGGYVVAMAVALSRPEGIVFAGVAMIWSWVVTRRREQIRGLAVVAGLWLIYWLARASYFGQFWPNTYYVKSGHRAPASTQIVDVLSGLVPVLIVAGLVLLVAALASQVDRRLVRGMLGGTQDATPAVLVVTSAVIILGLYHASTLTTNVENRFQWQLLLPVALVTLSRPLGSFSRAGHTTTGWSLPAPAEVWALLSVLAATVTSLADTPARLSQLSVSGAALIVAVAIVLRGTVGSSDASILAAFALAVVLTAAPVGDWVNLAVYRIRLQYSHGAMGQVINGAPFDGAVAIGDAGLLPFSVHQPVIDLGGLANAAIAHGTFSAADLDRAHLQMVVALSSTPGAGSEFGGGLGEQVAYSYMNGHGWPSAGGPPIGPSYYLDYWIAPAADTPRLQARLQQTAAKARAENLRPDSEVLFDHLLSFPFLHTGNG